MFLWMICGQRTVSIFELLGLFLILCIGAAHITPYLPRSPYISLFLILCIGADDINP